MGHDLAAFFYRRPGCIARLLELNSDCPELVPFPGHIWERDCCHGLTVRRHPVFKQGFPDSCTSCVYFLLIFCSLSQRGRAAVFLNMFPQSGVQRKWGLWQPSGCMSPQTRAACTVPVRQFV